VLGAYHTILIFKNNQMTKEEIIKEAYLKLGYSKSDIEIYVSINGWSRHVSGNCKILTGHDSGVSFRPEELFKIENNNGWVKIYCENDMPQFDCDCFGLENDGKILLTSWVQKENINEDRLQREFWKLNLGYYKIIETIKLPLY
jgi:hypothetical protein